MSSSNIRILIKAFTWLIAGTNTNTSSGTETCFYSMSGELPVSRSLGGGCEKVSAFGLPGLNLEVAA